MALDTAKNFAKATVSTTYDASATSIVVTGGHGAKLPAVPFNATWWNATDYADPSDDPNVEIVRVTAIATDTLTVTRGQEGITATTKNTAGKTYKLVAGLAAKTINSDIPSLVLPHAGMLTNGTFGLWLRGTTFATNGKGPDPWQREANGTSTLTVDRAPGYYPTGSIYCLQMTYVHGSAVSRVFQAFQDWRQCWGKTVTFRAWIKTSVASAVRVAVYDGVGRTYSSYHTGSGTGEQLKVEHVVSGSATVLHFEVWLAATGTYSMDAADAFPFVVVPSDVIFWETTPLVAKLEVHKYYQIIPINVQFKAAVNNQKLLVPVWWLRDMYGTPVVSVKTTGTRTNLYTGYPTYTVVDGYGGYVTLVSDLPGDVVIAGEIIALESYD